MKISFTIPILAYFFSFVNIFGEFLYIFWIKSLLAGYYGIKPIFTRPLCFENNFHFCGILWNFSKISKIFFINRLFTFCYRFPTFSTFIRYKKKAPLWRGALKINYYLFIWILRFPIAVASIGRATTLLPVCFSVSELR